MSEHKLVQVPPIVDKNLWSAAQARLSKNKQFTRSTKYDYLLSGFIWCGSCGHRMTPITMSKTKSRKIEYYYYRCAQRNTLLPGIDEMCHAPFIRANILDEEVWDFVLKTITDDNFEQMLYEARAHERDLIAPKQTELKNAASALANLEVEMRAAVAELPKTQENSLAHRALQEHINQIEQAYGQLQEEHNRLQLELNDNTMGDEDVAAALQYRKDVIDGLAHASYEDKRRHLETLQAKVTVTNRQALVELRFPGRSYQIPSRIATNTA